MARIRSIKPDFWESEDTATLPMCAALTYAGLWNYSDDEGRGRFQPGITFTKLHGLRPDGSAQKTRAALDLLIERKLIVLYESEQYGTLYYIPSFKKHQHPDKPQPSKYPTPPLPVGERSGNTPVLEPERSPLGGEGRGEGKGIRIGGGSTPPAVSPPSGPEPTDDDIIAAVHRWDPTFPEDQIRIQTTRAVRLSVTKARLLNDIQTLGDRMRIWTIVDAYQYPKGNGKPQPARENATAYLPTGRPTKEQREAVDRARAEAIAKADEALEAMDADERDGWTRDAEAEARRERVPDALLASTVKSKLRTKIAKENGIEGL